MTLRQVLPLISLLAPLAYGQVRGTTNAACSPIVNENRGTIDIHCSGFDDQERKQLAELAVTLANLKNHVATAKSQQAIIDLLHTLQGGLDEDARKTSKEVADLRRNVEQSQAITLEAAEAQQNLAEANLQVLSYTYSIAIPLPSGPSSDRAAQRVDEPPSPALAKFLYPGQPLFENELLIFTPGLVFTLSDHGCIDPRTSARADSPCLEAGGTILKRYPNTGSELDPVTLTPKLTRSVAGKADDVDIWGGFDASIYGPIPIIAHDTVINSINFSTCPTYDSPAYYKDSRDTQNLVLQMAAKAPNEVKIGVAERLKSGADPSRSDVFFHQYNFVRSGDPILRPRNCVQILYSRKF